MSDKRRYYTRLPAVGPDDDSLPMPGDGFEAHASERGTGDTGFFSGDGFGDGIWPYPQAVLVEVIPNE